MLHEKNPWKNLKLSELHTILRNISLGKEHLLKLLGQQQFQQFLDDVTPNGQEKSNLKTNKQEKTGRAVLVVNTIITGCLGAWLGMAAYSHIKLDNSMSIVVILASFILGGIIAILSFNLTHEQTKEALTHQKILDAEFSILNLISRKQNKMIERENDNVTNIISFDKCSYIKSLLKAHLKIKKNIPRIGEWMRMNIASIIVSLMPALIGGFASMFVLIDGIPSIFLHYKIDFHLDQHTVLFLKIAGLVFAIVLTVYYGYSQIYTDYKTFRRRKQLEITESIISEKYGDIMQQKL